MRRLVVVAAVAALTLVPITATAAPGSPRAAPAGTFWYREDARALAEQTGALQVKAGTQIVMQTHILGPGTARRRRP